MTEDEVTQELHRLGGWEREGDALVREFEFANFVGSVEFVNRITPVAEEMNHHPDLAISWNKVKVSLSTHSEGGITRSDFELAAKIDALA